MSDKRYTISVSGTAEADVTELFPGLTDPSDPTVDELVGVLAAHDPWTTVIGEWGYGDELTVQVTDTVAGTTVQYDPANDSWDELAAPAGPDHQARQHAGGYACGYELDLTRALNVLDGLVQAYVDGDDRGLKLEVDTATRMLAQHR